MADITLTDADQDLAREALNQIEAATAMLMAFITDAKSEHSHHVRSVCVRVQALSDALLSLMDQDGANVAHVIHGLQQ